MARLTLRLPKTLHNHLEDLAHTEGISLNQYIVYALTRQATMAYSVQAVPDKAIEHQQAAYAALLEQLGAFSHERIAQALDAREVLKPEDGLSASTLARLRHRIHDFPPPA
jgi:HicB family